MMRPQNADLHCRQPLLGSSWESWFLIYFPECWSDLNYVITCGDARWRKWLRCPYKTTSMPRTYIKIHARSRAPA